MWGGTDERGAIDALHASIDSGINLIDTAPAYGMGRSEQIVGKAIQGRRDRVLIATKCGLIWDTDKGTPFVMQDGHQIYRYLGPLPRARMRTEPEAPGNRPHGSVSNVLAVSHHTH